MMRSNSPIMLALPPFRGVTRRLILIALTVFFVALVLSRVPWYAAVAFWLVLQPAEVLHHPWQLLTYAFFPTGLLSTLFALLSVWFFGSSLEDERGPRWLTGYFLVTVIGGALLASALSLAHVLGLKPSDQTAGLWPAVLAILLAYARFHPDQELRFNFILTLKAKYLAAIYLLLYLALALIGGDRLGATVALGAALCGYLYLRLGPRRGLSFAVSEQWFAARNAYIRARRRRAARQFTVHMKKQGKDVSFDSSGKYIGLDDEPRRGPNAAPKDLNDKRWMN